MEKTWISILFCKALTILFVLALSLSANSQQLYLKDSIPAEGIHKMQYDADGNLYALSKTRFYKFPSDGKNTVIYQLPKKIVDFTIQTRYKIFLFSKSSVVVLNQQLIPISEEMELGTRPLATAQQQHIFMYDPFNQTLLKYDLLTRQNVLFISLHENPRTAIFKHNKLYILYSDHITVYDDFLNVLKQFKVSTEIITEGPDGIYILNGLTLIDPQDGEKIIIPVKGKTAAIRNGEVTIATEEMLYVYEHKK